VSDGVPRGDLLERVLAAPPPAFALLYRPLSEGSRQLQILVGELSTPATLADVALPDPTAPNPAAPGPDVLVMIPYRQIAERGFICPDDGAPLLAMTVSEWSEISRTEAVERIPDLPVRLSNGAFRNSDEAYADVVRRVIEDEIGTGEGANFVIRRTYLADLTDYSPLTALAVFRRLLVRESSTYWTFLVHTGERTFVGASPERHVSLHDGVAVMNPISGTYRYPPSGPTLDGVLDFLAERKEIDELYMVVDEELKMMARICDGGGRVVGPYLKEMAQLAHTEYLIEGRSSRDPREILRETMFAPTVTGSPLENACRVINRYEPEGRGYYSGVIGVISRDARGRHNLDSAILIRTAEIDSAGRLRLDVGATLVRHSDPDSEVAEVRAKAAGLLAALTDDAPARFAEHPRVRAELQRRNTAIAPFWLDGSDAEQQPEEVLVGKSVLVIDAEDTFTLMMGHQLRALGLAVAVRRYDEPYDLADADIVVMGPGPGNPCDAENPKIARLDSALRKLLLERRPFLAVCLSHQVLCARLGLPLRRREVPNQGVQREIDLFDSRERVGFYNTFTALAGEDKLHYDGGTVEISRDPQNTEVYALRGPHFASVQFHPESILTRNGVQILAGLLAGLAPATFR
jgi:phenazine biosynthesis protein phzE